MIISGDDIKKVGIGLASPEEIRSWSQGEVIESETINYRTHRPERGGLYAEEIFGPERDYECACGKYRGRKYEGIECEKCGVLVTDSQVRRINMGHIELASPVVHFWFLKGISSPLSKLLGIKRNTLKKIAYYETELLQEEQYIITSSQDPDLKAGETLYKSELEILSHKKDFQVEPCYLLEETPEVKAGVEGEVAIEQMKLANGEGINVIKIKDKEYPLSPDVEIMVNDGDTVEKGDLLAESPVSSSLVSKTKFSLFKSVYSGIEGNNAIYELDNLIFLITSVNEKSDFPLKVGDRIWEISKRAYEKAYPDQFEAHTGAKGIKGVLASLDLNEISSSLKIRYREETSKGRKKRILNRLEVVEQLRKSDNRTQDIVLEIIPVLPPALRPMVQIGGGKFATTDLNDLYRRIINRNNRLKKLKEIGAPEVILRNERRMLQEAVDALIHNEKKDSPIRGRDNRPLKSLSERISGKHGRMRRNLLGRRVDYSGRAVIVVNPTLKLRQCGLPKKMALELFKPFILQRLGNEIGSDFDEVKNKALKGEIPEIWNVLEELVKEHPVLLNRAPTLHRLGIQSFEPLLVDGDAIQIHPLVCPPYNADFDGDQMAVHLPLSQEAVEESREIMAATKNILSPANGEPLSIPTQDQIFAFYYLTIEDPDGKGAGKYFTGPPEAERAYQAEALDLHSPIKVKIDGKIYETTLGRVKLNSKLPKTLRDYSKTYDEGEIEETIMQCYREYGDERCVLLLDDLKELGFEYATSSGLTMSIKDCRIPPEKEEILENSYRRVGGINEMYDRGLITAEERRIAVIDVWRSTVDEVEEATMKNFQKERFNPIYSIVKSGARGSANQAKQLAGMRGPMAKPSGEIIEMPVVSNFREGLDVMEYFISTHGGRKGAADTALKTADAGYLTRRLVDATEEIVVREEDCKTGNGVEINPLRYDDGRIIEGEDVADRLYGRVVSETVEYDGEVLVKKGQLIDRDTAGQLGNVEYQLETDETDFVEKVVGTKSIAKIRDPDTDVVLVKRDETITGYLADRILESDIKSLTVRPTIRVRSPLTCETKRGVCQICYGLDLSTHQLVQLGQAVGVIAAQAIGEPGTQLTMRTFHTGGVVGKDITQGLPRAEELFEARKKLKSIQAEVCDISGHVMDIGSTEEGKEKVNIRGEGKKVRIPTQLLNVEEGDVVDPHDIISRSSPLEGDLRILAQGTARKLYILDGEDGDRIYYLPEGVKSTINTGQKVKEGTPITEPFHRGPILARQAGVVEEIAENEGRTLVVRGENDQLTKYKIPYGARKRVEVGDEVEKSEKLSTRSRPIQLKAENPGVAVVSNGVVIIYDPAHKEKEYILTSDLKLMKGEGDRVSKGEALFQLDIPAGGPVVIEEVGQAENGTVDVKFHYESSIVLSTPPVVGVGDKVGEGDLLSKGVVSPHLLLKVAGVREVRDYLLTEIHKVYKSQGVDINDKHIEIVIRQMLNNVSVQDPGDSELFPNQLLILEEFRDIVRKLSQENREIRRHREELVNSVLSEEIKDSEGRIIAEAGEEFTEDILRTAIDEGVTEVVVEDEEDGRRRERIKEKRLPVGERILLRVSKSALETKSFLSAASFQRTTSILREAAIQSEVDHLEGLKPNVIISKKIPVGTGYRPKKD